MSYVFTAEQQAEIDVLVTELTTLIETTLPAQETTLETRETDWRILRQFVENQRNQQIWDDIQINPDTGKTAWGEEQDRRTAVNAIIGTYSIPQMWLPDILCGIADVYEFRAPAVRALIFGTIEADIATSRIDIDTKKDELLLYYETLTGIDPLD